MDLLTGRKQYESPIFLESFHFVAMSSEQTCHALLFAFFILSTSGERNRIQGVCSGTRMACMHNGGKKNPKIIMV